MESWSPESWRHKNAAHQPAWPDREKLDKILGKLRQRLPLVFSGEVELLKDKLALAARGEMFLLHGGDCAERFNPTLQEVENKLKILLQMNMVLMYAGAKPVIKVGRFAGQYAKPRSRPTENIAGRELPSYFGDIVNRPEPDPESRALNPKNLLDAYNFSCSTLNIIRSLSHGGFADLHRVHEFNKEFIRESTAGRHYEEIASGITRALHFMDAASIHSPSVTTTDFYTSHEALLLDYETALTRQDESGRWYDLSAHMLWIGERTRQTDGAHVEFMRGINNPIGVKLGPATGKDELKRLLALLNPANEWGRITLITRLGADRIAEVLPQLITAVREEGARVLWSCDPMHANVETTPKGYKTRNFSRIMQELQHFLAIHNEQGTVAGGIHLELTGDAVSECTGGAEALTESSLEQNYATACDPRLNAKQALELAFLLAKELG